MMALLGVAALAAACGSTADPVATGRGAGAGDTSFDSPEPGGTGSTIAGDVTTEAATTAGDSATTASGQPASSGPAPAGGGTGPAQAGSEPQAASTGGRIPVGSGVHGVTDSSIEVGLWYFDGAELNAAMTAVVGSGTSGDLKAGAQSVVDYINAHGGIAGRKLVPIYYKMSPAEVAVKSQLDRAAQEACASFTEDHKVFAMIALPQGRGIDCAVATKTIFLGEAFASGPGGISASMFQRARDVWYGADMPMAERRDRGLVEALWQSGFLNKNSKVGLLVNKLSHGDAARESAKSALIPALQRHGLTPVRTIEYGEYSDPWDNYMVQFRSAGVTHILYSATGDAFTVILPMRAAQNQQYYPKWGISSDQMINSIGQFGAPKEQMANAAGMGWVPAMDVQAGAVSDPLGGGPGAEVCKKIQRDSGNPAGRLYCDGLLFLKAALDRASEVSVAGMKAAVAGFGNSYSSAQTIGGLTTFGPDRHDGVSQYQLLAYDALCGQDGHPCFKYTSPPQPLP